jgi:uncharacterized protein YbjT (DUF2867 family)
MILITGARWNVGSILVQELLALGQQVRLLVRNPEKAAQLAGPGVELFQGCGSSRSQVSAAMKGVDRVLLLSSGQRGLVEFERTVISAAQAAGVQHLVKLSASLVGPELGLPSAQWQWQAEERVRTSGIAYTLLRPAFSMQEFFHFARSIRASGAFHASLGNARLAMVDTRDVAAVAARVLTGGDHARCTYVLTGPEALTFNQAAEHLSSAVHQRVHYVNLSPADHRERLLASGVSSWEAEDTQRSYELMAAGCGAELTCEVRAILGRAPRTFSQFARDYAVLFTRHLERGPAALAGTGFTSGNDWRLAALKSSTGRG